MSRLFPPSAVHRKIRTCRFRRWLAGLILAVAGWSNGELRAADIPADFAFLPDEQVLERAAGLSLEDRRYLVYLYARLNKPHVAQSLATGILAENPSDRQTLLVLASMSVEQQDPQETLRIARLFLRFYPGDHQGRYFLGAGHYLAKQYAQANAVLRDLKQEQFSSRKYPYETDLAASAYAAGDWYRAMLSYQELLRNHELGDELRDEVRRVLDSLYREHRSRVDLTASTVQLERSRIWRYGAAEASHVSDQHWLALSYTRDDITLEEAPSLRATRSPRAEAAATLTTVHDRRWTSDKWIGASGDGVLGGIRLRYLFARERMVSFEVSANARATDSLALEFLDGRENRTSLGVFWRIEADLVLGARTYFRQVYVADERLGQGAGVELNLDQTFTRQGHGPQIIVGYRGAFAEFSAEDNLNPALVEPIIDPIADFNSRVGLASALVSTRLNRHGFGFIVTDNLRQAWVYRLSGGSDYDFELSSLSWNAALALTFFPRKSIELTGEFGYTSSASASNAGSSATIANLFLRSYY